MPVPTTDLAGQLAADATAPRRERSKALKQARIARAARELFERDGFAHVTVQEVAERADVGAGTLFRYAATKAELLLMVSNEGFERACDQGRRQMAPDGDPTSRLLALLTPAVRWSRARDDNTLVYQREILFGDPSEHYRSVALRIVTRLEETIAEVLQDAWRARHRTEAPSAGCAARTLFAAVELSIFRAATTGQPTDDLLPTIADQIALVVAGYLSGPQARPAGQGRRDVDP